MGFRHPVSRRRFFGGVAAAMGVLGLRPTSDLFAQGGTAQFKGSDADYDSFAKLASNENNWGPPEAVNKAMATARNTPIATATPTATSCRRLPIIIG